MRSGQDFIKHEMDEAIAFQQAIVDAEQKLASSHPLKEAQDALRRFEEEDQKQLQALQELGRQYGASGKKEEVAEGMIGLMQQVLQSADEAPSEAYEAHAVLVTLKHKQTDAADAMVKIAREMDDTEMKQAASEMHDASKRSAQELANLLSQTAVEIAKPS